MLEQREIKVLAVNAADSGGGAAHAAYRIHKGVNAMADGVKSRLFVKHKSKENDDSIVGLEEYVPHNVFYQVFAWIRTKVRNKIQHARWRQYPKREQLYMSDARSTALHGVLQKQKYDVLHLHWINDRFVGLDELKKIDKPIVWTLHDAWPMCGVCHYFFDCNKYQRQCGDCPQLHSGKDKDLSRKLWEKKRRCYDGLDLHIVTPSRWLAACVKKSSLFGRLDVRVIPNCIDTNVYRPKDRNECGKNWEWFDSGKHYLLYGAINATTDRVKGFDLLCVALEQLSGRRSDLELILLGGGKVVETPIKTHSIGYIRDVGQMVELYNIADVTIVPSRTENLSFTIMESLSCGTPVCCFDIGGNEDLVEHKQNGYVAKAYNTIDLADGVEWCLEHNRDGQLSKNARSCVLEKFTIENVSRAYVELYEELVK